MPIPSFCIRSSTFGALLFSLASISAAPDWSVWRGPQGNGHYDHESTWSHDWPATAATAATSTASTAPSTKKPKGFLRCINATSGETVWTQEDLQGSLIVSQNKLLILTNNGSLIVAEASPKGFTQLARHTGLGKRTWAPPVLHQGRLYTRDADGSATCLDLRQTPP